MEANFILTDNIKKVDNHKVYQIKAIRDLGDVKSGTLGGWVSDEESLNRFDGSWADADSVVIDSTVENTQLRNTTVRDSNIYESNIKDSTIYESNIYNSKVCDSKIRYAEVEYSELAKVETGTYGVRVFIKETNAKSCQIENGANIDNCKINGREDCIPYIDSASVCDSTIENDCTISNNAKISSSIIESYGGLTICDKVEISDSNISGEGYIRGRAVVDGSDIQSGFLYIEDDACIYDSEIYTDNISVAMDSRIDQCKLKGFVHIKDGGTITMCKFDSCTLYSQDEVYDMEGEDFEL